MKISLLLSLVIAFFLFTRLFFLPQNPGSLYWDEASIGYNAYSISESLKDEWGDFLPVNFRAFGEFKLPVYIYSVAIFVKFFGLNEWAIRLPAVLYSLLTVILLFLISKKIFLKNGEVIGLLSSFILTIIPWFFLFSRTGYEATAGVAFFCLGFYFYLFSRENLLIKILTLLSFLATLYSYNSFRIITPIFLTVIFLNWFKESSKKTLPVLIALLLISLASFYPVIKLNFFEQASRFQTVSIFSEHKNAIDLSVIFLKNYFSHLTPDFLLIHGDNNLRSHTGYGGMLYYIDIVFALLGLIGVIRYKEKKSINIFIILFLSFIPAAVTKEAPHGLRSILFAPFIAILISYGIFTLNKLIKFNFLIPIVITVYLCFFSVYYLDFIKNFPKRSSLSWQYPYKLVFEELKNNNSYDKIFISDSFGQPYIFALYYLKYDLNDFQRTVEYNSPNKWGNSLVENFGNYSFNLNNISGNNIIIFAMPGEYKGKKSKVSNIKDYSGKVIFNVYE